MARRRLELLSAELAAIRPDPVDPPSSRARDGSGEPPLSEPRVRDGSGEPPPDRPPGRSSSVAERPDDVPPGPHDPGSRTGHPWPGRHAHRPVGRAAALSGWVEDRLPPTLQGRVRMSTAHLVVVAVVVSGGLALTGWWVSRAGGADAALPLAPPPSSPSVLVTPAGGPGGTAPGATLPAGPASAAGAAGPAGTASPPVAPTESASSIVVDVAGKVRRPGIAELPLGSRVVDALEAAGGARHGVRLGALNLARVLVDGEQIVVGVRAPPGLAASAASAPTTSAAGGSTATPMVNINTAGQAELETLPDVGPVTAKAILDFRAERGTFTAVDELLEVSGIGDATLAKIAPYVTL